jgi:transposase
LAVSSALLSTLSSSILVRLSATFGRKSRALISAGKLSPPPRRISFGDGGEIADGWAGGFVTADRLAAFSGRFGQWAVVVVYLVDDLRSWTMDDGRGGTTLG